MKYVITGTSCAGKSTTLDLLAKAGFSIVTEAAEEIIIEQKKIGGNLLPDKDVAGFQDAILERQLEKEGKLDASQHVFLDRSIVDQYGYCSFYKIPCPKQVFDLAPGRYDKVFLLEPLPFYDREHGYLDRKTQLEVDREIRKGYEHFGYECIAVPFDKPQRRVELILNQLEAELE